ncbi:glycosyltransferase [uncultured Dokdonia sp.]|uniref:glycosyltransferase n=1 Tax=uncultured Dokdonia sp. TaxID=575653 RepID=UPI002608B520|nr:glycosyltransferase [uncultured Dokdonia sp.]
MKKLVIIQTVTPDYRAGVFKVIREALTSSRFELYRGKEYFEKSVKTDQRIEAKEAKNIYLLKRTLLFQIGIWHLLFKKAVLVLEMNPRILSNWIFLIVRRLTGRETVLWGHAWPRSGKGSKSDWVRNVMRTCASSIIVYTKQQQKELSVYMPQKTIYAAPNAILHKKDILVKATSLPPKHLIYVGRLSEAKKPLFLVRAFKESLDILPEEAKLIMVGEGEQMSGIQRFIKDHHLEDRILLKGHINDYEQLKSLYNSSIFSVSPGYVGLSITQSFGFGVPMLISKEEPHSPEIEAVNEGKNAIYYETDDIIRFRESVKNIYSDTSKWIDKRTEIALYCKENYSVESMATTFINLVNTENLS